MVLVAQLVEPRIVDPLVVGSIPILHPNKVSRRAGGLEEYRKQKAYAFVKRPGKPERLLAFADADESAPERNRKPCRKLW